MFSHVHIGTNDLERAVAFYNAVLKPLGLVPKFVEHDRGWAGWKGQEADRPLFLVGQPFNKGVRAPGNGSMIAFLASERKLVDLCYQVALAAGADDEGAPGLRPEYHAHYYGAYFRDPDGNKICVCCHEDE